MVMVFVVLNTHKLTASLYERKVSTVKGTYNIHKRWSLCRCGPEIKSALPQKGSGLAYFLIFRQ